LQDENKDKKECIVHIENELQDEIGDKKKECVIHIDL
jgi:hypothetical protein